MARLLGKDELISALEAMQKRYAKHGNIFAFEVYVGLTFASSTLVDDLAALVKNNDQVGFAKRMNVFQDRFRAAPDQIKKSLRHYLGRRHDKLNSFGDLPGLLELLKK